MITERDAESGRREQHREQGEVEPINTEIPQVKRHCRECENKRTDQERASGPVNAVGWNAKNQERENFAQDHLLVHVGRPRITSSFFQECTLPQCTQVNLCLFSFAVGQRFSSIVLPVSVSFDVEGQRTSKLLIVGPAFTFGRRGGSNRNLVGMSEAINDTSFRGVVRRHLHSHSITDCKPNETFAHLSGNVRENQTLVRERDAKHGPRQHHHDGALQFDGFFRIHDIYFARVGALRRPDAAVRRPYHNHPALPALAGKGTLPAMRTRTLFARTRFVNS
jgi:hypothetical protein